ncbi:hypothetical protein DID88_001829 [Monilinia fructigena]|uniref:Vacuolar sorting protein 39/Transforming growth factor beta receptor-associated domain-containing protein n=1 Tax=Monilinia fructigena TaxID=38457 RepID=A0A395IY69_9HELO|nr:hypothetical protein DID88_001829 [Monilinia fructigena]
MLEVRNPDTLSLLQSIPLPNASQLHFPPPNISLAHAGKGFHVASERCIWRMGAIDYDSQIDELVAKGRYDESLSILNMLEDALLHNKTERVQQVEALKSKLYFDQQIEQAQSLFNQRRYRAAIDIFIAIEAPPERVIKLYPKAIAGDLSIIEEKNGDVETDNDETSGSTNSDSDSKESLKPAAVFWKPDNSDNDNASIKAVPVEDGPLEGKDLITAAIELNSFLVNARTRMKKFLDSETGKILPPKENGHSGTPEPTFESLLIAPESEAEAEKDREQKLLETAKLVDTTLFRSYMLSMPSLAGPLFRLPNFCDPDVVNEKLLETGRYNDLVDFFHGKKLHRPALELLKKFGRLAIYKHLPPEMIDLILEFAEWPLRTDPNLGMEIFLADTEIAETLPRNRVLNFLHNIDINLEIRYLEHLINELNDMTPDFHNRLAGAYMQELKQRQDRDSEEWTDLMERMVSFLRSSKIYSCGKAFGLIDREDPHFYEAQAIVLSNIGSHKQALEIYVFKIKDFEKAEEYCNRVHMNQEASIASPTPNHRASTSEQDDPLPSIYHTLLSLYLKPLPPFQPNWPPALKTSVKTWITSTCILHS